MKILVACEESQAVAKAFRKLGHEAYSCDLMECSGGHPEWHYSGDVTPHLALPWDMVIAFPPCTHLCNSGSRWWPAKIKDGRQKGGIDFFMLFVEKTKHVPFVAIENPVGIMSRLYRKPDQIVNPFEFGHPECKRTCLWLKGLPNLVGTNFVPKHLRNDAIHKGGGFAWNSPECAIFRSKTFQGIADAMASQWGGLDIPKIIEPVELPSFTNANLSATDMFCDNGKCLNAKECSRYTLRNKYFMTKRKEWGCNAVATVPN